MNYSFTIPSLLILIIIMGYYFFRRRLPIRLNRAFLALLITDIFTVLMDLVSSRLDDTYPEHSADVLWVFNMLFFLAYFTRIFLFYIFIVAIPDARGVHRIRLHYTSIPFALCSLVALSSPLTRWLFWIDESGYHSGPLYMILYFCAAFYLLVSAVGIAYYRHRMALQDVVGAASMLFALTVGNVVRLLFPKLLVMDTFCLMAILIIYLSFLNPDLYLSERGYVYNMPAFRSLLLERVRKKAPCSLLGIVLTNYNEHREIFGGPQMDDALTRINRYLLDQFPRQSSFYLRNGCYTLMSETKEQTENACAKLQERFAGAWKTRAGDLVLDVAFVRMDTDLQACPADRLLNTLLISMDEAGRGQQSGSSRDFSDALTAIGRKLDIRRCLEKALEQDELEVWLQPIVSTADEKPVAAEALVRLRDDDGAVIEPDLFINLAEREGYISRLGEQVMTKVCRFLRENDPEKLGLRWINVNLSPVQFMSQMIPERFTGILREYGIPPKLIHLEITEQSMIDFALLKEQIDSLHSAGFEFALDDYGSGFSNLTRVRRYPFSNIKVDMEVIRNYCSNPDPLLPALVRGFREMNFTVTAEGIETRKMADALQDIGFDYYQGFYFSQPLPMKEFLARYGNACAG